MRIILIRHGMTEGNREKRYIGLTDEPLSTEGRKQIMAFAEEGRYPKADAVYVSPLRRCIETVELIYPDKEYICCDDLKECNFGEFENKNYMDLAENEDYKKWIDSGGKLKFPSGEEPESFKKRCQDAFLSIMEECIGKNGDIALAVHGGTIMAILEEFGTPKKDFYDWQLKNGEGYICELKGNRDRENEPGRDKPSDVNPKEEMKQNQGMQARSNQSQDKQDREKQSQDGQGQGKQSHGKQSHGNQNQGKQSQDKQNHGNQNQGKQGLVKQGQDKQSQDKPGGENKDKYSISLRVVRKLGGGGEWI